LEQEGPRGSDDCPDGPHIDGRHDPVADAAFVQQAEIDRQNAPGLAHRQLLCGYGSAHTY
jgi:hypothetical protein